MEAAYRKGALDALYNQLDKCQKLLLQGYRSDENGGIDWLNSLCGNFLGFANTLQSFYMDLQQIDQNNKIDEMNSFCLCLAQICTCTKYLERIVKAEQTAGVFNIISRTHFLDRIKLCLEKLANVSCALTFPKEDIGKAKREQTSDRMFESFEFSELIYLSESYVQLYCSYTDEENIKDYIIEGFHELRWVRDAISVMIGQVLGLANVALNEDKPALSSLCQTVFREFADFEEECVLCKENKERPHWNRRIFAIKLQNSLSVLTNYVNDVLMRLIFTCFLDFDKYSLDTLRAKIRQYGPEDTILDEFIADFDINLDRIAQIGLFVVQFNDATPVRTMVRSSCASLEALDTCLIPSLHDNNFANFHSEILEEHFNEEIGKFKKAIYELVDSKSFMVCYYEMLTQCIKNNEKEFNKSKLNDIVQMGDFLIEHFQLPVKRKALIEGSRSRGGLYNMFDEFTFMLRECQAILVCADQVEKGRVMKRLKILHAVLRKFRNEFFRIVEKIAPIAPQVIEIHKTFDLNNSQAMFESVGIIPPAHSILYKDDKIQRTKPQNYIDNLPNEVKKVPLPQYASKTATISFETLTTKGVSAALQSHCSVYRKESLRTAMFKRQKSAATHKVCDSNLVDSTNLHITEILDQLTLSSSN